MPDLPAVSQSCERLRAAAAKGHGSAEAVAAIESDLALAVAVMRSANRRPRRGTVASIPDAVAVLQPARLVALADSVVAENLLEPRRSDLVPEPLRLHSLAVHRAVERLNRLCCSPQGNEPLLTAALLHDIGKIALRHCFSDDAALPSDRPFTPEAGVEAEQRAVGIDHAAVGATLVREWGLPETLAEAIEGHHSPRAAGNAGIIQLADLLVHYGQGHLVDIERLVRLSRTLEVTRDDLSALMYELPYPITEPRRSVDPCPLSERELAVLEALSEGKTYKQIAAELALPHELAAGQRRALRTGDDLPA